MWSADRCPVDEQLCMLCEATGQSGVAMVDDSLTAHDIHLAPQYTSAAPSSLGRPRGKFRHMRWHSRLRAPPRTQHRSWPHASGSPLQQPHPPAPRPASPTPAPPAAVPPAPGAPQYQPGAAGGEEAAAAAASGGRAAAAGPVRAAMATLAEFFRCVDLARPASAGASGGSTSRELPCQGRTSV